MLAIVKKIVEVVAMIQNNPLALVTSVALTAMALAAFCLYVIMQVAHK